MFEALDGTCFDKKENCERYEDQLKYLNKYETKFEFYVL